MGLSLNTEIYIQDDFNLKKIMESGQCFRVKELEDNIYRFIKGSNLLYIKHLEGSRYAVNCSRYEWDSLWFDYFDLSRNYSKIRDLILKDNDFIIKAANYSKGIRILKQDAWEMVITFIISQRRSIPAISKCVELLSKRFGKKLDNEVFAFPSCLELSDATKEELDLCGLGYRTPYVLDAVSKITNDQLNLSCLSNKDDEELYNSLIKIHGVGKKVANCIMLYGFNRLSRVPVDVWISRAIEENFSGDNIIENYKDIAGIIQQYVFYYKKNIKQ